jgi:hypothetical protein
MVSKKKGITMKWDSKNKERLYGLIYLRLQKIKSQPRATRPSLYDSFRNEFGIERVKKTKRLKNRVDMTRAASLWMKPHTNSPARDKDRVIILDPWWGQSETDPKLRFFGCTDGLSIPKEVAEKFLVLGVP